jgi:hypothetical protein
MGKVHTVNGLCMHTHLLYVQYLVLNKTGVLVTPTGSLRLAIICQAYAFGRLICVIIVCFPYLSSIFNISFVLTVLPVFNIISVYLSSLFLI